MYHLCHKGRRYTFRCREGHAFDEASGQCLSSLLSCSSFIGDDKRCSTRLDDFYSDFTSRDRYIGCRDGRTTEYICAPRHRYDVAAKACTRIDDPPDKDDQHLCRKLPDGYFNFDDDVSSSGCRTFTLCTGKSARTYICPGNLKFDFDYLSCQYADVVDCPDYLITCEGLIDGVYPVQESGCKYFYHCENGTRNALGRCAHGMVMDAVIGRCVVEGDGLKCPKWYSLSSSICQTRKDGFYQAPKSNCTTFYQCMNGRKVSENSCGIGQAFDISKRMCKSKYAVQCTEPEVVIQHVKGRAFSCAGKANSMYPDYAQQCQRYYVCEGNRSTLVYCPDGFLFNSVLMVCDHEENVRCTNPEITIVEVGQEMAKLRSSGDDDFECPAREFGFFADFPSGCQKFHICYKNMKKTYSCPSGLLFNPDTRNCDSPINVNCMAPMEDRKYQYDCESKNHGYYLDPGSNCTRYYSCMDGEALVFVCPPGKLFNQMNMACDLARTVNCQLKQELPEEDGNLQKSVISLRKVQERFTFSCHGKNNGFYPDYDRDCHVFYRCNRGKKYSHYCKRGLLFNPVIGICDFERNVTCEPPILD